jgi:hypothetical protein
MFSRRRVCDAEGRKDAGREFRLDTQNYVTYSFLKAISFLQVHASWGKYSF